MTSIADAFPTQPAPEAEGQRRRPSPRLRVVTDQPRPAETPGAESGESRWEQMAGRCAAGCRTVWSDLAKAWPWHGTPPTLAELVAGRIPDIETVPGQNRALWIAWTVYNHAVIAVYGLAYPVLWWLAHPARALLTAAVAAPLFLIWP